MYSRKLDFRDGGFFMPPPCWIEFDTQYLLESLFLPAARLVNMFLVQVQGQGQGQVTFSFLKLGDT